MWQKENEREREREVHDSVDSVIIQKVEITVRCSSSVVDKCGALNGSVSVTCPQPPPQPY